MSGDGKSGPVRRPRRIARPQVAPGPLRDLKDLLYRLYVEAGAPSLDEIHAEAVREGTETVSGWPSRDSIRRIIAEAVVPPSQADVVAVAAVLARLARWDPADAARRARELWVRAQTAVPVGVALTEVVDPFALEVHRPLAVEAGAPADLPVYVPREHDRVLAEVVAQAAGGASRVVVLVGGSSTGKTRACWEALRPLRDRPEPWRLWHPIDPTRPDAALADLGRVGPHTVVWLNEAQFYLGDPGLGERVASGLRELVRDVTRAPVLVLATLWPQHWDALTVRTHPDEHAQARELLDGHSIRVPEAFTGVDLTDLAVQTARDPRLAQAAENASDGQITQYLAGVPVLMDRYANADPATRALIHAAMDARRLGCGPRIPLTLLAEAAPGYLTDAEWDATGEGWLQDALKYVATPCNGIPGILTPVKTTAPRNRRRRLTDPQAGSEPSYRLADYLDQHGRTHRADQIPPMDFWTAVAAHAHPGDLKAFGDAARDRGLYRDAAQLYKHATTHGSPQAAVALVNLLYTLHPADHRPAQWAATVISFDDLTAVADLLDRLLAAGADDQVAVLADQAVAHAALDDRRGAVDLWGALWRAGAHDQIAVLLDRVAAHAALDDPSDVDVLLSNLWEAGAHDQVAVLLARDPAAQVTLHRRFAVADLLGTLQETGAHDQVAVLARRVAEQAALDDPSAVAALLVRLRDVGAHDQVAVLAGRVAEQAALTNARAVADLLGCLQAAGAHDRITALLAGDLAEHVTLDELNAVEALWGRLREAGAHDQATALAERAAAHGALHSPFLVASLMDSLRRAGAHDQAAALAERAAAHGALDDPFAVAWLLDSLQEAGAHDQVAVLLARDPAAHAALDIPFAVASLLDSLQDAGAHDQIAALLERDPAAHAALDDSSGVDTLLDSLREVGAHDQIAVLLERDPAAHAVLRNPSAVASLLVSLRRVGAHDQVSALAERAAAQVALDSPFIRPVVDSLLDSLREVGAHDEAAALAERLAAEGRFDKFIKIGDHNERFRFGQEPDTTAAAPWTWDDLE